MIEILDLLIGLAVGTVLGLIIGYDYAKWKFKEPDEE